jgi:L-glyceraldehyde 3-phosphate reductase
MALAWVLRHKAVTSALIGASRVSQVDDCVGATRNLSFSNEQLAHIKSILSQ